MCRPEYAPSRHPPTGGHTGPPLRGEGEVPVTTRASGAQRSVCAADGRNGVRIRTEITPKVSSNAGQSLSQPAADSSLYTREPLGTGDADCRVGPAGLLAMTSVFCHSEERSDVEIRPFYDGRGFGPPYLGHGLRRPNFVPKFGASVKSSAPTERRDSYRNHPSQRRTAERLRRGHEEQARIAAKAIPKGGPPRDCRGSALSAERAAGQIRFLPDNIRVQHGVQRSEASAKPRPCSRRGCVN